MEHLCRIQFRIVVLGRIDAPPDKRFIPSGSIRIRKSAAIYSLSGSIQILDDKTFVHLHVHQVLFNRLRLHLQKLRGLRLQFFLRQICMAVCRGL